MSATNRAAAELRQKTKALCETIRIAVPMLNGILFAVERATARLVDAQGQATFREALESVRKTLEVVQSTAADVERAHQEWESSL